MHHGVTFNFGSAKVCSPAIFETSFMTKIYGLLLELALLHNYAISDDSFSPINKFYSFIIFSLLINGVILLLNCLVLTLYLYTHFLLLDVIFSI